jgi:hypothetical protein
MATHDFESCIGKTPDSATCGHTWAGMNYVLGQIVQLEAGRVQRKLSQAGVMEITMWRTGVVKERIEEL